MTYKDVVNSLVCEIAPLLDSQTYIMAFNNAPSVSKLQECEVPKARKEVASKLGQKSAEKKKRHHHYLAR